MWKVIPLSLFATRESTLLGGDTDRRKIPLARCELCTAAIVLDQTGINPAARERPRRDDNRTIEYGSRRASRVPNAGVTHMNYPETDTRDLSHIQWPISQPIGSTGSYQSDAIRLLGYTNHLNRYAT